jgi:excisionase family DNA binding protein
MPDMTMRQAAEWAGVTRGTIHKAITSGRISASKSDTGVYRINPAELERVYPQRQPLGVSGDTPEIHRDIPELIVLRREVELLREMYRASEMREADLRAERVRLIGIVENTTRMLTYEKPLPPSQETRSVPNQTRLGQRLGGWMAQLRRR